MKLKKAIKILERHNAWRRWDNEIYETPPMQDPTKLGTAIDTVVKKYKKL